MRWRLTYHSILMPVLSDKILLTAYLNFFRFFPIIMVSCSSAISPFQAARGGGKIFLKGLYSGLAGNLAGVLP